MKTKKEIRSTIEELEAVKTVPPEKFKDRITARIQALSSEMEAAPEDFVDNILKSHRTLCNIKNMGLKDAYGQDPIMYYTLGMVGEVGEIANKLVKGHRNGYNAEKAREAVRSELPDAFIYGTILAYVANVDIQTEINDKVEIVVQRAKEGYYGNPFMSDKEPLRDGYLISSSTSGPRKKNPVFLYAISICMGMILMGLLLKFVIYAIW